MARNTVAKLNALQTLLGEKRRFEAEILKTKQTMKMIRKELQRIDAALALHSTRGNDPFFDAIESSTCEAVAGRIGVG